MNEVGFILHQFTYTMSYRTLQKTLLQFYASLMGKIVRTDDVTGYNPLKLVQTLCQCLDVAGSPNYYDLPLLESSLECLRHLTAR